MILAVLNNSFLLVHNAFQDDFFFLIARGFVKYFLSTVVKPIF